MPTRTRSGQGIERPSSSAESREPRTWRSWLPAATDCSSGAREILHPEEDGLLVPPLEVPAFADALVRLAQDQDLRNRLASAATGVCERFGFPRVMAQWDELFAQLTGGA